MSFIPRQAKENPLKTLLEIMTSHFLERTSNIKGAKESPSISPNRTSQVVCIENYAHYCLPDGVICPSTLPENKRGETYR